MPTSPSDFPYDLIRLRAWLCSIIIPALSVAPNEKYSSPAKADVQPTVLASQHQLMPTYRTMRVGVKGILCQRRVLQLRLPPARVSVERARWRGHQVKSENANNRRRCP